MMNGAERIAAERQRQIDKEGWTPEHDARHSSGELVHAAIRYAAATRSGVPDLQRLARSYWQWDEERWKPSVYPIRNLEKAGALIAAEIDRLLALRWKEGELKEALKLVETRSYFPSEEPLIAAARAVLDGREVWWCEEHGAEKYPGRGERCRVAEWAENEPGPCRMKQVRIIDVERVQFGEEE